MEEQDKKKKEHLLDQLENFSSNNQKDNFPDIPVDADPSYCFHAIVKILNNFLIIEY